MKTNKIQINFIFSVIITVFFLFIAFGSDDKKSNEKKTDTQQFDQNSISNEKSKTTIDSSSVVTETKYKCGECDKEFTGANYNAYSLGVEPTEYEKSCRARGITCYFCSKHCYMMFCGRNN